MIPKLRELKLNYKSTFSSYLFPPQLYFILFIIYACPNIWTDIKFNYEEKS